MRDASGRDTTGRDPIEEYLDQVMAHASLARFDHARVRAELKDHLAELAAEARKHTSTQEAIAAMLESDYEIYMVSDASGGTSKEAHDQAMARMIQAGVVPVTWQQVMLEWQRDWARRDTYDAVMAIAKEHSGAYGMGVDYAYTMVHKQAPRHTTEHQTLAPVPAKV